ncbi:MAG: HNH endonuclease [Nitrososphaera sp.]
MKIVLQPPYAGRWRISYLSVRPDGRKVLSLYNGPGDRSSVNYARYLKEVELGEFISPDMHVDHENENRGDDSPSNLRVISARRNIANGNRARSFS